MNTLKIIFTSFSTI